jgi:hypothetical protein
VKARQLVTDANKNMVARILHENLGVGVR